jgi:hypothetical protein
VLPLTVNLEPFSRGSIPDASNRATWRQGRLAKCDGLATEGYTGSEAMARSDLLIDLVRAGATGNQPLFRRAVEALIVEERAKQHHVLADRLEGHLKHRSEGTPVVPLSTSRHVELLVDERSPERRLGELVLPPIVRGAIEELVEEHNRSDLLRSHNLEPRHRVLLVGSPGNGKTSLAEAIASEVAAPLFVVRYEGVITSYLGETALRLAQLFDFVRTRRCVLFFDEFDVVGKERGDTHETGEIKRVVSSILLQLDALPSTVIAVTATNHPELLDRAAWRRFQIRLTLPPPGPKAIADWFARFERTNGLALGLTPPSLARQLRGASFAELEEFTSDILRRHVLSTPSTDIKEITRQRLQQWRARSVATGQQSDNG